MARIRTIKPEFWTDGAMIRLPLEVRLFYIGLWNFACDRGHMEDDPLGLKLKVLPADAVDPDDLIRQLVEAGRLERLAVGGKSYLAIPSFADHQRVDTRWKSRCLVCAQLNSDELTETHASLREPPGVAEQIPGRKGGEGKGKESKGGEVASDVPPAPSCRKHVGWQHDASCGPCGADRRAFQTWETEQAAKPKPVRPHVHEWFDDGTCLGCDERKDD